MPGAAFAQPPDVMAFARMQVCALIPSFVGKILMVFAFEHYMGTLFYIFGTDRVVSVSYFYSLI